MKKNLFILLINSLFIIGYKECNAQGSQDTVSFETPTTEIVILPTSNNLWQIGVPQKTFFNSPHRGTKVIVTDTINDYPVNDTSSFIYIIRNPYTQTCRTCMEFWHKYDMDSLSDKGIIDASYDGGNSWIVLNDSFNIPPESSNFAWNPDYHLTNGNFTNHKLISSGKSDGWIKSSFCWQWFIAVRTDTIIARPDSLMIRFTFISDSVQKNKEGWMIDDIVTSSAGGEECSGIAENSNKNFISVYPNPFSLQTNLQASSELKNSTLTIYNSLGQIVREQKNMTGFTSTILRGNLPDGLYFMQLKENNKIIAKEKLLISSK